MYFEIVLLILIILTIADYFNKTRITAKFNSRKIKVPQLMVPFLGHIQVIAKINVENLNHHLQSWHQKYGNVFHCWCFNKCLLFVQDAHFIEGILSSSRLLKKNFLYDIMSLWLGNGILLTFGSRWQNSRKITTSTFSGKILEKFVEIFDQQSHSAVNKLRHHANGENAIDIYPLICSTSLDILLETAMGVKISAYSDDGKAYREALEGIIDITMARCVNPLYHFDFLFKLLAFGKYRKFMKNIGIVHSFTEKLINERREKLIKQMENKIYNNNLAIKKFNTDLKPITKFNAFLDMLLQATLDGQPLTNKDIHEEVNTITFGGHDTVSVATSFTIYLLSRHSQVQQKVFEEILSIIGSDTNKPIQMKELQELKYLECVIKESLRLYTPGNFIGRKAEEDLKIGESLIPRNTEIILLICSVCRNPDYFPNPHDFIPERFLDQSQENINPYAFIPFSVGPRNCAGQKYAMLEMKSIVSCILRHYELLPLGPEVVRTMGLVTRSKTGVHIGLKPRVNSN